MRGRVGGRKIPDESRLAASLHARRISEVFIVHYRGHIYKYSSSEPLWGGCSWSPGALLSRNFPPPPPPRLTLICHLIISDSAGLSAALSLHAKYFRVHFLVGGGELDHILEDRSGGWGGGQMEAHRRPSNPPKKCKRRRKVANSFYLKAQSRLR